MKNVNPKLIIIAVVLFLVLITGLIINPFSINDAGNRTVVERTNGELIIQFNPGVFYAGFFAKETEWPNQISVLYNDSIADYILDDNGIEIGVINVRFSDATTANLKGIAQYILPSNDDDMILLHSTHRNPSSLVSKRLAPYTKECLQSSAQLMTSEKHYGGGRAQMAQDFLSQLKDGVYLLRVEDKIVYDSLEKENKRIYETEIQIDKTTKMPKRKISSIKEYGITVADGAITDVDYETKVDKKLEKIIDAVTQLAISKQDLMTAQQKTLTAKAQGEQALVEVEYSQKKEQTIQVVAAQTLVEVEKQNLLKQKVAFESALLEAKKIKEMANAEAYAKKAVMTADGALETKIKAYVAVQDSWAKAFGAYTGNITPTYMMGGSYGPNSHNGAQNFMDLMSIKAMKDLNLELKNK